MQRATFGRSHVISHCWYASLVLQKVVLVPPLPLFVMMLVLELTLLLLLVVTLVLLLMLVLLLDVTELEPAAALQANISRAAIIGNFMFAPQCSKEKGARAPFSRTG